MHPNHPPILAVDSDGCALDAMEIKHRQCFTPTTIAMWGLQAFADRATEACLTINLYSQHRGLNRFAALAELFASLRRQSPQLQLPDTRALEDWVKSSPQLSANALLEAITQSPNGADPCLQRAVEWSRSVDRSVAQLDPIPAFAGVAEALRHAHDCGIQIKVVSSATRETLLREWSHAQLAPYADAFHGQEDGSKATILRGLAARAGTARMAMVGDALGDQAAAAAAGCRFFPIVPKAETQSWQALKDCWLPAWVRSMSADAPPQCLSPTALDDALAPWLQRFAAILQAPA